MLDRRIRQGIHDAGSAVVVVADDAGELPGFAGEMSCEGFAGELEGGPNVDAAAASPEFPDLVDYGLLVAEHLHGGDELNGVRAARHAAPLILMHNRSQPSSVELQARLGGVYIGAHYADLLADVRRELEESASLALQAGVPPENIVLDPGIGFGKTRSQNLELIDRLGELRSLGYPILLGPSRKSFIGYTLDLPPEQRLEGTAAAVAIGIARGADIVRVHDVEFMLRVARMTDAIVRKRNHDNDCWVVLHIASSSTDTRHLVQSPGISDGS